MSKPPTSFESLSLSSDMLKAIATLGYEQPYPIQEQAIPPALARKDILGIAQTGSGKTASFVIPVLEQLIASRWEFEDRHIPALILVPTRELAEQVHEFIVKLTKELPIHVKSMAVYGGISANPQMKNMSGVQVLVATPGRLLDLISQKALHLSSLKMLVLDEADKMLNMGFKEAMDEIFKLLPVKRQNLLFSATLSKEVSEITQVLLAKPVVIEIEAETVETDLIQQRAFRVAPERKGPFIRYLIKSKDLHQVLVFVSSIKSADQLVNKLEKNGIQAKASHSKKTNKARLDALNELKSGALRVLVATDLLSRGIDIEFLPYVINFELPRSPKDYIHRIGRTGRAENPGEAFSIVTPDEQQHFRVIQKKMGKWLTLEGTEELDLKGF